VPTRPERETTPPADGYDLRLNRLRDELLALRAFVVANANERLACLPTRRLTADARESSGNLARYLALRSRDLRPLQEQLAEAGLSSLGRGESHVLANIDRIIAILARATGAALPPEIAQGLDQEFDSGSRLLAQRAARLFGPPRPNRGVRIMVTLPGDAAEDGALLKALLEQGMECVRINCAHDGPAAWTAMLANLRRASEETGRRCQVLMDLAGPKLRTGPIEAGPATLHVRVERDEWGRVRRPSLLLITDGRDETPNGRRAAATLRFPTGMVNRLAAGDHLDFEDTRGKRRSLTLIEPTASGAWLAKLKRSTWIGLATIFHWQRTGADGERHALGRHHVTGLPVSPVEIRVRHGDTLLLTRGLVPGRPAEYDHKGALLAPASIGCIEPAVVDQLRHGDPVWIDDGKVGAIVEKVTREGALLRVSHAAPGGVRLNADKGLNFPQSQLDLPSLSAKDLTDLDFVCAHADLVGFSFVEDMEDMEALMQALAARGATGLPIVAKIETATAVRNLPDLMFGTLGRHPLGVMIARGDLAVELGNVRTAEIQEEILWLCEAAHVPVIWATQVLETVAKKGLRSRGEFTDAAMGVRAECVMLNKGPYIVDAVRALDAVLTRMQDHQRKKSSRLRALHW
jgi:pyruvate kinase